MQNPLAAEIRHMRSGSLNIAPPPNGHGPHPHGLPMNPMPGGGVGVQNRFDQPRSPPNTSHVPCKFFRQGACQAGSACPFSHDLGPASETVCKYFAKGNCKFGPKCANIHVLPDGRRINYGKNGVTIGVAPINLGSRVNPATYGHPSNNSALTSSFMRGDGAVPPYTAASPYPIPQHHHHLGRQPSLEMPTIDTTYSSNPASAYGSPRDNEESINTNRFGLGLSPVANGLSVLDAPLPASFDSNGISHAARYGPWPASVPSKFGLESPSHSLNAAKDSRTSETLKLLHTSAFGSSEHLNQGGGEHENNNHNNGFSIGSSPPVERGMSMSMRIGGGVSGSGSSRLPHTTGGGPGHYGGIGNASAGGTPGANGPMEEYFGKEYFQGPTRSRAQMHSSSSAQLRYGKPRLLSSSAPKGNTMSQQTDYNEWEPEFQFEEDYIPGALANEVLTPAEKARRGSTTNTLRPSASDNAAAVADEYFHATGRSMSIGSASAMPAPLPTTTTPNNRTVITSAGSPSRWGPLFNRQKAEEERDIFSSDSNNGMSFGAGASAAGAANTSRSLKHANAFGHVGSPLRNSSLANGIGAEIMKNSPSSSSSPRPGLAAGNRPGESLSALTQQLRQTSLDSNDGSSPHLHPNAAAARNGNNGPSSIIGSGQRGPDRDRNLERHVSSGSIGSSGRFTTPIDEGEEDAAFVFRMEEEEENHNNDRLMQARMRVLGTTLPAGQAGLAAHAPAVQASTTPLGNGWSYASAVAAGRNGGVGTIGGGAPGVGAGGDKATSSVGTVGGR